MRLLTNPTGSGGIAPQHLPALLLAAQVGLTAALAGKCGPPRLGAVASECDVCSRVGTALLQGGGNAVDALVGAVFCVGVVGMYHSGIGGGGFLLLRTAAGEYEYVDFREKAPAAAFEDMYRNNTDASLYGGLASGVPGELHGLSHIHSKYGKLAWKDVLAPAIKLARFGFQVNEDLIRYMNSVTPAGNSTRSFLTDDPTWAIDFAPHGQRVALGETMTRKRYANTLEIIADEGPDAFYTGALANATITALRRAGGTMTLQDLANYTVEIRTPAEITYRGFKIRSCGAPAGGGVALSTLKIVEGYEGFRLGPDAAQGNLSTQRLDEAMRFAYAQRTKLGDPSYVEGLTTYQAGMLSAATAAEVRAKISDTQTHDTAYYDPEGLESLETPGTSHVAAADASGMAVSLTTTVNLLFGSRLMVPETGVIMNNEMNDFSIPGSSNAFGYAPSPANYVRPGKRPLSSITPVIVETADGRLYLVVGAAGGSRIITSTVQNVLHVLDGGKSAPQALASPRLHDQLVPSVTSFEWAYDNATVAYLRDIGHNVSWVAPGQSAAQAVRLLPNGTFEAAGEPRQRNSGGFAV